MRRIFRLSGVSAAAVLAFVATPSQASEGGSSVYVQGTYNDFAAAVFGPEGVYLRTDIAYYDASVGARPLGGRVQIGANQEIFVDMFKLTWLSDAEVLGARVGAGLIVPVIPHVNASLSVETPQLDGFIAGDNGGMGDIVVTPILLGWTGEKTHFVFLTNVFIPTGKYDNDRVINLSKNHWAVDPGISFTYLDPESGIDISATAGIVFNFENPETDYTTGNELHIDFNIAKMFSQQFGVGLTGYYYNQISDDEGDLPAFASDGFQGRGAGVGPSVVYSTLVGGAPLQIIGKAVFDIDSKNRFEGDIYMISLATKL